MFSLAMYMQFPRLPLAMLLIFNISKILAQIAGQTQQIIVGLYRYADYNKYMQNLPRKEFNQNAVYMLMAMIFVMIIVGSVLGSLSSAGIVDRNNLFVLVGFSAIQFGLFLCIFFVYWRVSGVGMDGLRQMWLGKVSVRPRNLALVVVLVVVCITGFFLATGAFEEFLRLVGFSRDDGGNRLGKMDTFWIYLLMVLVSAVLPAVVEEIIFRGAILRGLMRYGPATAVILSSVLFSLVHMNPLQTVYQFALGIVLALVVLKTGKLIYAIILHFINNFAIITYTFITGSYVIPVTWSVWTVLLAVALVGVAVALIRLVLVNLKNEGQENQIQEKDKLFSFDSIGALIVVTLVVAVWFSILLG